MKTIDRLRMILGFLGLAFFRLQAQVADSAAVAQQVDSLIQVSRKLAEKMNFEQALAVNAEAEKLVGQRFGRVSEHFARLCQNRGRVFYIAGDYPTAEKHYREAAEILEKAVGKEHLAYGSAMSLLGNLYWDMGSYEKAIVCHEVARDIRLKKLGKNDVNYARSLLNLAALNQLMDNYEKALQLYAEGTAIIEKTLGKEHEDYAVLLNNLASMYKGMGQYDKAIALYNESKTLWENKHGKENRDYAALLNNHATLYKGMGNFEKAEAYLLEAKAIWEKTLGAEHPDFAWSLNNLANLYLTMDKPAQAEPLFLQAKNIREKALGKEHNDYAASLDNLANFYKTLGNYEKAEPLYLEAKNIWEKIFTKQHSNYGHSLNNLANLYVEMGEYRRAEPLFWEAKTVWEKVLGKTHPGQTQILSSLAKLYAAEGNFKKSEALYAELADFNRRLLSESMAYLSENELNKYVKKFAKNQDEALSFAHFSGPESTLAPGICFDNALFHKGFLLNAANRLKHLAGRDSATSEQFDLLKSYSRRLAAEYSRPPAKRDSLEVRDLEEKSNALENELARNVAGFGESLRQVSWQEVQAALGPGEVAVEFVHCQFSNPKPTDSVLYAALVLAPNGGGPRLIPLFEEKQLARFLNRKTARSESIQALYASRSGILDEKAPAYGSELYKLVWKPLEPALRGAKTVFFSPSGLLHRLNLAALPTGKKKKTTADRYELRQLSSTRNLVFKNHAPQPAAGQSAVLFGGIRYDADTTAADAETRKFGPENTAFRYLPGAEAEVVRLEKLMRGAGLSASTETGSAATEERLKSLGQSKTKSPEILHVATHGFFFDDPEKQKNRQAADDNVFRRNENPLFRSGLAFAGANHVWLGGQARPDAEDGICTAYEISHLNLSNTKLAVLSACETGLGDIRGSEGVYGLQRAFKMAGVDYLLVSLWQVPDVQTAEFMDLFYGYWLGGKTIRQAFGKAQKKMKKRYGVFEWGAWVLIE